MKQKIYILGLITALLTLTGSVFKINHYPGAGILLSAGIILFVLVFIPAALMNHYKSGDNKKYLTLYLTTWLTCLVVFTAMLFKLQHWPGAGLLLTIAIPFPYLVFLPVFLAVTSKEKSISIYDITFVLLLLVLNSVFSGMLSLNPTKERIDSAYLISAEYNIQEQMLSDIADSDKKGIAGEKIDALVDLLTGYQQAMLSEEGLTIHDWVLDAGNLNYPDRSGYSAYFLGSEGINDSRLFNGLKELAAILKEIPYKNSISEILYPLFELNQVNHIDWNSNVFEQKSHVWTLADIDQLQSILLSIKATL